MGGWTNFSAAKSAQNDASSVCKTASHRLPSFRRDGLLASLCPILQVRKHSSSRQICLMKANQLRPSLRTHEKVIFPRACGFILLLRAPDFCYFCCTHSLFVLRSKSRTGCMCRNVVRGDNAAFVTFVHLYKGLLDRPARFCRAFRPSDRHRRFAWDYYTTPGPRVTPTAQLGVRLIASSLTCVQCFLSLVKYSCTEMPFAGVCAQLLRCRDRHAHCARYKHTA